MGCILSSDDSLDDRDSTKGSSQDDEVYIFAPRLRVPKSVDIEGALQGIVSPAMATRLASLRSRVVDAAGAEGSYLGKSRRRKKQEDGSGSIDLEKALGEYLPVLLGLTTRGDQSSTAVNFEWTNEEDEKKETMLPSAFYELLSILHALCMLALHEANTCLTPRPPAEGYIPKVSEENRRMAIEILLKAAQILELAISDVLSRMPDDVKVKLPADLSEGVLRAFEQQALGQAVEMQLAFAMDNVKASLAVKRRLACEKAKCWEQAHDSISCVPLGHGWGEKHLLFIKWKLAEAKAAAYYYHGLVLDEAFEDDSLAEAVVCLKTANVYLKQSQRAMREFSNTAPVSRMPPVWGSMKYLFEKIPRDALSKTRVIKEMYPREKAPTATPDLPDFALALKAEPISLPPLDAAWQTEPDFDGNTLSVADVPILSLAGDVGRQPGLVPPPTLVQVR